MSVLDGQEVISAISLKIRSTFTSEEIVKIYKDTPIQNMQKPCVFLHSVESDHTPRMRNRATWGFIVDVRCHPKDGSTDFQTWARGIAVRVINAVEQIQVSGQTVKASRIGWNTEGGVLHVIIKYSFGVVKSNEEEIPNMENLEYGNHIR